MKISRGNPRCTKDGHTETFTGSDGFERCKDCRREYYRKYKASHPEYAAKHKNYTKEAFLNNPEYRKEHRVKHNARNQANYHRYKLKKEACERCGSDADLHMHHDDYSKPLDVITLCRTCHEAVHHNPDTTTEPVKSAKNAQRGTNK